VNKPGAREVKIRGRGNRKARLALRPIPKLSEYPKSRISVELHGSGRDCKPEELELIDAKSRLTSEYLEKIQKIIVVVLTWTMAVAVLLATIDLIYNLALYLISPPFGRLETDELLSTFGNILLVIMGVELLETFKTYKIEHNVNAQMVLLVALTAMARKVVTMELNSASGNANLLGVAAVIIALSAGYYLVKKGKSDEEKPA
jgi:uncharacterized membrane protein (DUF373 family)